MMNLNELAKDVHNNAKEHGWWDEERSFGDIIALCHSELSEALEEFRNKRPNAYTLAFDQNGDAYYKTNVEQWKPDEKPEGIAVELADCIIRILDFCGKEEIDIENMIKLKHEYNKTRPYRHGGKAM